jgi:hypothetical protein
VFDLVVEEVGIVVVEFGLVREIHRMIVVEEVEVVEFVVFVIEV